MERILTARLAGVINEYQLADELDDTYGVVTVSVEIYIKGLYIKSIKEHQLQKC